MKPLFAIAGGLVVAVGLAIFFMGGGWIGLGVFAAALVLIGGFAG